MTDDTLDIADKIAMIAGGGLIVLAIPVIGFFTTIAGSMSPFYKYQVTTEGGKKAVKYGIEASIPEGATILVDPLVDPMTRGWIAFIGLLIFAVYAVYRVAVARKTAPSGTGASSTARAD
ncbi:MAG: hypothetical protein ABEJ08_05235 [Halobacteriaceae archaeon]